jgi:hypothetical protein
MKRAILIVIAALLVLLVYPSTHPYAKSPIPVTDTSVIPPLSGDGPPIAFSDDSDDDSDDGDMDGIGGFRDRDRKPTGSSNGASASGRVLIAVKMWWNYMIWIR